MSLTHFKKGIKLSKEAILFSKPIKNTNVKFDEKNEEIYVIFERKKTFWTNILAKIFFIPKEKTIILDKIGSEVVKLCNGEKRVYDIVSYLAETHKLTPYEAEVSLLEYFKQLVKRGIIGLEVSNKYLKP